MNRKRLLLIIIPILIIFLDQLTKFLVDGAFILEFQKEIIPNVLSIVKTYNTGIAFSLFKGHINLILIITAIAAVGIFGYLINKINKLNLLTVIASAFILGGAFGNLIDRALLGHVIDFISLDFISFPIFNLADIAINIGAIILLYIFIGKDEDDEK